MLRFWMVVFGAWVVMPVMANDCLQYKLKPRIDINIPDWVKEVVQPRKPMDLWHGNVVATFVDNYDVVADVKNVKNGFCVVLKNVNALIGYDNFRVSIDIRHDVNSCAYNAILKHEDKHIDTYLSVVNDFKSVLHKVVYDAADSVMPMFIKSRDDVDIAIEKINNQLQNYPDLILIKQKIKAEEEIRNKRIDRYEDGTDLIKCFE